MCSTITNSEALRVDVSQNLDDMKSAAPHTVINTCGPYSGTMVRSVYSHCSDYSVLNYCIKNKWNYIDLASEIEYHEGLKAYDQAAKDAGVCNYSQIDSPLQGFGSHRGLYLSSHYQCNC